MAKLNLTGPRKAKEKAMKDASESVILGAFKYSLKYTC
jgi:hypothetical protein